MDKASRTPQQTEDGCELFGCYVTSEVRAISKPQSQLWAKLQIQMVLFNAQTKPPHFQPPMTPMDGHYPQFPLSRKPSISPPSSMADHSSHSYSDTLTLHVVSATFQFVYLLCVIIMLVQSTFLTFKYLSRSPAIDSKACFWNDFANCLGRYAVQVLQTFKRLTYSIIVSGKIL